MNSHCKTLLCFKGLAPLIELPLSLMFFAQITHRNCLKFMFTPSLHNHAGCQIDHSRNNTIFSFQFPFSRSKICHTTPSRFPLRDPWYVCVVLYDPLYLRRMKLELGEGVIYDSLRNRGGSKLKCNVLLYRGRG